MRKALTEHRPSPLARKATLWTIVFSSALSLAFTSWQLYHDYQLDLDAITSNLNTVPDVHIESISASLWATDYAQLRLELEGMLRMRDMHYVAVREGDQIWAEAGKLTSSNILKREFPIVRIHRGIERRIGVLIVVATLDGVYRRLWDHALIILGTNAIKTFLVAGFMLLLFQRLITRHVQHIARQVAAADTAKKIELTNRPLLPEEFDELDDLVYALNQMRQRIHSTLAELENEKQHVRALFDHANDAIFVIDPATGTFSEVNRIACQRYGYSLDELKQSTLYRLGNAAEREHIAAMMRKVAQDGAAVFEQHIRTQNGDALPVEMSCRLVKLSDRELIVGFARDIRERKAAEAAMRQLNSDLERRVRERTTQLESSNKELESFCYSVSHDLRAPLRAIDGFSHALLEDCVLRLTDSERDYLNRICASSKRMGQLIDDLLRLSRLTRAPLTFQEVDLTTLAGDIITPMREHDPKRSVDIVLAADMHTRGDEGLLRTALENLLGNAWKYTSKRPHAQIAFGREQRGEETVYFVKDNGAGFDMRYASQLFGAFQRLHDAREFQGTGIGLATTKRIISRHGGRIWAEAQPDKGASFYFTLGSTPVEYGA